MISYCYYCMKKKLQKGTSKIHLRSEGDSAEKKEKHHEPTGGDNNDKYT